MKTLILGGASSGKSLLAEKVAQNSGLPVTYIATAQAGDDEMRARIRAHRQRRPATWRLIEEPLHLARVMHKNTDENRCLLIDCLTLWLTNLLLADDPDLLERERRDLLAQLTQLKGSVIFVSNETSMGITPMDPLSRRFTEDAGRLHQELAQICDRVVLSIAGLPHVLKGALDDDNA